MARLLVNAGADPGVGVTNNKPGGGVGTAGEGALLLRASRCLDRTGKGGEDAGMTPLHLACRSGRSEVAAYLIRVGASVSFMGVGAPWVVVLLLRWVCTVVAVEDVLVLGATWMGVFVLVSRE